MLRVARVYQEGSQAEKCYLQTGRKEIEFLFSGRLHPINPFFRPGGVPY